MTPKIIDRNAMREAGERHAELYPDHETYIIECFAESGDHRGCFDCDATWIEDCDAEEALRTELSK